MSAGSTNADSDNNEDNDFPEDDDDSDNYRDDDSSDDDNDSENDQDDDSSDEDDDSYEKETFENADSKSYTDQEAETEDKSDTDDNTAENQRGDQGEDGIIPDVSPYKEEDREISESDDENKATLKPVKDKDDSDDSGESPSENQNVISTDSSDKDSSEEKTEKIVGDNNRTDNRYDDTKSTSSVPTEQNKSKDTKVENNDGKTTDGVNDDKDADPSSSGNNPVKDSGDNSNTSSGDNVKGNSANAGSSSTSSQTGDSSTRTTTNTKTTTSTTSATNTISTTENSANLDTGSISIINSNKNDNISTISSSASSSADSLNTSRTINPVITQNNEANVSVNVSSAVTEDANFLKDFRDSTEAHDNIELKDYSFASLVKGKEAVFEFGIKGNNIVSIIFMPEVSGGQVKTVVEILKNTSTLINEEAPGVVYKNFNIWVGDAQFSPYMTNDAKVNFKVEKDWLLSNNINHESIVLYGHVNGWNPLVTEKTGEDDTYVYYTAHTPVFSVFAIVSMDYEPYKLDKDQAVSTIGDTAAASGGMDEIPHYNTYRNVALLLVSLLVAGVVGMTGLKYMARSGNEGEQENIGTQFKK